MRTIETTVYKFSELDERAKEKAVEGLSDINVDYSWWRHCYDTISDLAKMSNVSNFSINGFDLGRNSSISLVGYINYTDLEKFAKEPLKEGGFKLLEELQATAKKLLVRNLCPAIRHALATGYHNGFGFEIYAEYVRTRYGGDEDTRVDPYFEIDSDSERMQTDAEICAETCEQFLDELKDVAFRLLQNEYDYLTSEKAIIETIESNEYEFTEDGELI